MRKMAHINFRNSNKGKITKLVEKCTAQVSSATKSPVLLLPSFSPLAPKTNPQKFPGNFRRCGQSPVQHRRLEVEAELIAEVISLRAELRAVKEQLRYYES
jgi:hypothetical protein